MVTFVMLALGMISLAVFCILRDKKSSVLAIAVKSLTSAFFIATAISAFLYNGNEALRQVYMSSIPRHPHDINVVLNVAPLFVGGLVLGLIGDILLDFKIFLANRSYEGAKRDADIMTFAGMAAFGLGHVLYIVATVMRFPDQQMRLLWSALAAVGAVCLIFGVAVFLLKMKFGKFLLPSIGYAFLLCWFIALSAWQLASGVSTASILLLVGSILFIVSDLILSMTYFSKPEDYAKPGPLNPESKLMIVANHATYYFAQFLIALAILFL